MRCHIPELPEVDVMVGRIRRELWETGSTETWTIKKIEIIRQNGKYLPDKELEMVEGETLVQVSRLGKRIIFTTSGGQVESHNAMSGYWDFENDPWTFDYVEGARKSSDSDVRLKMRLSRNGTAKTLRFHDSRLFGHLRRHIDCDSIGYGTPEALYTKNGMNAHRSYDSLPQHMVNWCNSRWRSRETLTVCDVLLDQRVLLGIGNIYATEGLWRASVHPATLAHGLDGAAWESILGGVRSAMADALLYDLRYDGYLRVYRRERCPLGHKILCEKVRGRSSYFCGECQKKK